MSKSKYAYIKRLIGCTLILMFLLNTNLTTMSASFADQSEISNPITIPADETERPTTVIDMSTVIDVYNITQDGEYVLSNYNGAKRLAVSKQVKANVTLNNVTISIYHSVYDNISDNQCALYIPASATVNLTLIGSNRLQSGDYSAGIQVEGSLTITARSTGTLHVEGGYGAAAIGGGFKKTAGLITINGGTINAYESYSGGGACIGSGCFYDGWKGESPSDSGYTHQLGNNGVIIVSGGTVNAFRNGPSGSAAIGGGEGYDSGRVSISGGIIRTSTDRGGREPGDEGVFYQGAAIGSGAGGCCNSIYISGGDIIASSLAGAGIGSGTAGGGCGNITITGGTISATSSLGAGIGCGYSSDANNKGFITISGGWIDAKSTSGAGIGGGNQTINGGIEEGISINIGGGYIDADGFIGIGAGQVFGDGNNGNISHNPNKINISGGYIRTTGIGGGGSYINAPYGLDEMATAGGAINISGGTILSNGKGSTTGDQQVHDIGNGKDCTAPAGVDNYVCITGGNVYTYHENGIVPTPRDGIGATGGNAVSLHTISVPGASDGSLVYQLPGVPSSYGMKDVYTIGSNVYTAYLTPTTVTSTSTISGKFKYGSVAEESDSDFTATFFYNDDYFSRPVSVSQYQQHLATMSMCLALSAYSSNETTQAASSRNVQALMRSIGLNGIEVNQDYMLEPQTSTIGVCIGYKYIDGQENTLVTVALRGGGYGKEWAGNFLLGKTGLHEGFRLASQKAYVFLSEYLNKLKASNQIHGQVKIWVTGYSRAAATANLLAAKILDTQFDGLIPITYDNLYAYCFETPMGTTPSNGVYDMRYRYIYNIINPNDMVTKMAPLELDFGRYGLSLVLPAKGLITTYPSLVDAMKKFYNKFESTHKPDGTSITYAVDTFVDCRGSIELETPLVPILIFETDNSVFGQKIIYFYEVENSTPQYIFLENLSRVITEGLIEKSRENYVTGGLQLAITSLLYMLNFSHDQEISFVNDLVKQTQLANKKMLSLLYHVFTFQVKLVIKDIVYLVVDTAARYGVNIDHKEVDSIIDAFEKAFSNIDASTEMQNTLATLYYNCVETNSIPSAHYPELCLAWMQSFDSYYSPGAKPVFVNYNYRIARVNCPVEVTIRDSAGNVVAFISAAGDVTTTDTAGIVALVDRDGSRTFYIPADMDYILEIRAVGEGTVNYSVNEFSGETGCITKLESYVDVPIKPGDLLLGTLPAYPATDLETGITEGSSVQYTLTVNGSELTPAVLLMGAEAAAAYYYIDSQAENPAYGFVTGSGLRVLDSFALLEASAYEGHAFTGWYVGGTCVSTEKQYRFQVKGDITIVARFSSEMFSLAVAPANRGDIVPSTYTAAAGDVITVTRTSSSRAQLLANGKILPSDTFSMPAYSISLSLFDPPRTGDAEYPWLYLAAIAVSLALLVLFYLRKQRR